MSIFTELMGEDVSTIRAAVGARGNGDGAYDKRNAQTVSYQAIDMNEMRRIYDFYVHSEAEVRSINNLKNGYSLSGGVWFSFANEKLEEERFAITDHLVSLMREARQWHDMFGFVAIYNPGSLLDGKLQEIIENGTETANSTSSVVETSKALMEEAERLLERIAPDEAKNIGRIIGISTNEENAKTRSASVRIDTLDRVTTLQEPGAILTINSNSAKATTAQTNGKKKTQQTGKKRQLEQIADTKAETREVKKREQKSNASRTLDQTIIDLRNLMPVSIDDGMFYVETDLLTMQRRVVFVRRNVLNGAMTSNGRTDALNIDPAVYVHVWDGLMPERDGRLKTAMFEVIRLRQSMDEAERNAAAVDYMRSHPLMILEQEVPKYLSDMETMTNQQIYGGAGAAEGGNPTKEQQIAREAQTDLIMRFQADLQNGRAQGELAKAIASGEVGNTYRDANGRSVPLSISKRTDYMLLPAGVKATAAKVQAETMADPVYLRDRFRITLANVLNIPLSLLESGGLKGAGGRSSGASGGGVNDATNVATNQKLKLTIIDDRAMLSQFVNKLWDIMYRDIDNKTLEEVLSRAVTRTRRANEERVEFMRLVDRKLAVVEDLAEKQMLQSDVVSQMQSIAALNARLREIDAMVRATMSMKYRFQVHFDNLSYLSNEELTLLRTVGSLSDLEYANALRIANGMTELTQAEFDSNKQAMLDEEVEKVEATAKMQKKYEQKPTIPAVGSGNSSGGSKKK